MREVFSVLGPLFTPGKRPSGDESDELQLTKARRMLAETELANPDLSERERHRYQVRSDSLGRQIDQILAGYRVDATATGDE